MSFWPAIVLNRTAIMGMATPMHQSIAQALIALPKNDNAPPVRAGHGA